MLISVENLEKYGIPIDTFEYRGFKINLYEDREGRQLVAIWQNQLLELGRDNTVYQDDLRMVIDDYLDTISRFEDYPNLYGSKLEYFQNAGFRDAKLSYKGRIIKIYTISNSCNEETLIQDALFSLLRYKNEVAPD